MVWVDASSLASGIIMEGADGATIEEAGCTRRDDPPHISVSELDAAIRVLNMAVAWGMRVIELRTDSTAVHKCVSDVVSVRNSLY